jgi:hypothetical protein
MKHDWNGGTKFYLNQQDFVSNDINAKSIQKRILKLFTKLYKIYIALYELTN